PEHLDPAVRKDGVVVGEERQARPALLTVTIAQPLLHRHPGPKSLLENITGGPVGVAHLGLHGRLPGDRLSDGARDGALPGGVVAEGGSTVLEGTRHDETTEKGGEHA